MSLLPLLIKDYQLPIYQNHGLNRLKDFTDFKSSNFRVAGKS